jgi:hypothetical protein
LKPVALIGKRANLLHQGASHGLSRFDARPLHACERLGANVCFDWDDAAKTGRPFDLSEEDKALVLA